MATPPVCTCLIKHMELVSYLKAQRGVRTFYYLENELSILLCQLYRLFIPYFSFVGAKNWNDLPGHIKQCITKENFKLKVKKYLMECVANEEEAIYLY